MTDTKKTVFAHITEQFRRKLDSSRSQVLPTGWSGEVSLAVAKEIEDESAGFVADTLEDLQAMVRDCAKPKPARARKRPTRARKKPAAADAGSDGSTTQAKEGSDSDAGGALKSDKQGTEQDPEGDDASDQATSTEDAGENA